MEGRQKFFFVVYLVTEGRYESAQAMDRMGVAASGCRQFEGAGDFHGEAVLLIHGPAVGNLDGIYQFKYGMVEGVLRLLREFIVHRLVKQGAVELGLAEYGPKWMSGYDKPALRF